MTDGFDVIPEAAIRSGRATDAYFLRTEAALAHADRNPEVVVEVTADQFPTGSFDVFGGVKDVASLLAELPVEVDALPEGQLFDGGPVMRIRGKYLDFARYETAILGFLSQATTFATRALETRLAAPDSTVLSFGARHLHPSLAVVYERNALLAGLDGFSHVAAGDVLGREAGGTMPHALMLCFGPGNQEAAWRAFDETAGPDVPRVALVDTYTDESDEALRAAELLGDRLDSVRIDTTGSRRGDMRHIVQEVRWELDARGHDDVGIFCSGGMVPSSIAGLQDVADGFGIGSYVTDGDPMDFALDIVEVDGELASKRGKLSGVKDVYRTPDGGHHVGLAGRPGPTGGESLMKPLVRDGEVVRDFDLDAASQRCLSDADAVGFRADADWR